jgi:peptide/nickel transport system permease protein
MGLTIIATLVIVSIVTVIAIPYGRAIDLWRGGDHWQENPANASPVWSNWFREVKLPRTISSESDASTITETEFSGVRQVNIPIEFEYMYDGFPSELNLFIDAEFDGARPFARVVWHTPDGREILVEGRTIRGRERISISQDRDLERRLGDLPHVALFADPESDLALKGRYRVEIEVLLFDPDARVKARLLSYGRVHGLAGTDHRRRDIVLAMLWGTPIALAFGLAAAIGTTITTLIIAAMGVWFGGRVDATIQRITEVNMILPLIPVLVMVGTLYSTSIWLMLALVVGLSIFGPGIKQYRAMLLPIRQSPYIEAARSYGAGSGRIVLRYMIPPVLPVLIPNFVVLIPAYVFLEASLAVLGLGDPVLPTWGKVMNDALSQGALYHGYYYWVLGPAMLLMLTGLGFAMLGYTLDRVFNPRLRQI